MLPGIHIHSRPLVPDDSKAVWTSKISPKVILWTSKVLLTYNIYSKFSYSIIMYNSVYLSSDHFSSTSKIDTTIVQNNVFAEGWSSGRLESVKTQILPRQVYHQAYLPGCWLS